MILFFLFFFLKKFWKTALENTLATWVHFFRERHTTSVLYLLFSFIHAHSSNVRGFGVPPKPLTLWQNAIPPSIIFRFLNFVTYTYHIFYFGYPVSLEWIMNCFVGRLLHRFLKIRFQHRKRIPQLSCQKGRKKLLRAPQYMYLSYLYRGYI